MKKNGQINLNLHTSIFNKKYLPFLASQKYLNVIYGGSGSGKSVFMADNIIIRSVNKKNLRTLVIRKIKETIRESVFAEIVDRLEFFGIKHLVKINKTNMKIEFPNGSTIIFRGISDSEALKGISKIDLIWLEETTEMLESDFEQMVKRLRGTSIENGRIYEKKFQIFITFNPIDETHWLKKRFFDKKPEDALVVHSTYLDNRFVGKDYKKRLEEGRRHNENDYNIYALGQWGAVGSVIYRNYVKIRKDEIPPNHDFSRVVCGLDFGVNDPNAFLIIGIKENDVYILEELVVNEITNKELIEIINEKFPYVRGNRIPVIADSAMPGYIMEFARAGFNVIPTKKGAHSVTEGIDNVKRRKIFIADHCETFYKEIVSYKYIVNKEGQSLNKPKDGNDHCMDSLRYAVYEYVKIFDIMDELINPVNGRVVINGIKRGRGNW
ncbi:PBSX family phage terminase large subunit [Lysinibacillus sp. FSL K6-0057]|uniref:PBSX family phage terminase large subunit n=1 Tax=unclassified Lysinibacillus TaxID=2636778 RepID=UPI00315AC382